MKKKAALCLLRLFRENADMIEGGGWYDKIINLLNDKNLGVVTSVMSLIQALVAHDADAMAGCIPLYV